MRVGIFITRFICGGAQKVVLDLLRFLDKGRFQVTLIAGRTPPGEADLFGEIPADVEVIRRDDVVREISPLTDIRAFAELAGLFREKRFDILHLHTSKAGILGAFAGRRAGVGRIVYTPHGHIFHKGAEIPGLAGSSRLKMSMLRLLRMHACRRCDSIVALSDADLDEQVSLGLAPRGKFTVIMNGIDVENFASCDEKAVADFQGKWGLAGKVVVGSVGRLSREKGHDIMLKAFAAVRRSFPQSKLLLVGDGSCMGDLQKLAGDLGVGDEVVFTGGLADVRSALRSMDVFVLPSRYESQGIAAMEAMAAGVPVLASKVGGVPGIIVDNTDGILVEPDNPAELSRNICVILGDPGLRERLAANARRKALSLFRRERMVAEYENLYSRLMG